MPIKGGLILFLFVFILKVRSEEKSYFVREADTLEHIAKQHHLSIQDLIRFNGLEDPDKLVVGQRLLIPGKPGGPIKYVVQKGDTLETIAARVECSVSALVSYNRLAHPNTLSIGQIIYIPDKQTPIKNNSGLDPQIRSLLDRIRLRRWKYIVVHHSASLKGNPQSMDRYHREKRRMENGLAYHFVIGNGQGMQDGEITVGSRWKKQLQGGHLASEALNQVSIGICLVGNFDVSKPSKPQMVSLKDLSRYLLKRCGLEKDHIRTHRQINTKPTKCPGRYFSRQALLRAL
ncbi:MAG: LysM peptidoglycan-binding domain-containing protein [Kiritimatiellae bacterium]|nr:LysM peptidoglycan-binding domain-containing protein [Kiritimatiellia bacterium]